MPQRNLEFSELDGSAQFTGTSSPILRIPPEILSEIFSCCLATDGLPRPHPFEPPLLLCQVCSFFRTVALSAPKLWAGISIVRRRERDDDVLMLDMWINRSGSHPLSFSLRYGASKFNTDNWIGPLVRHSLRWKDITVGFPDGLSIPNFLGAMSRGTPALEKLVIKSIEVAEVERYSKRLTVPTMLNVSLAHNLKEITIDVQIDFQLDFGSSVLDKVKKVSFIGHRYVWICPRRIFDCLEHCPAIEKFACEGSMIDTRHLENVKPLTLPFLEHLYINAPLGNPHPMFDFLNLPGLLTLTLKCNSGWRVPPNLNSIANLLKRSGACIENLSITSDTPVLANHVIDYLENAPRLKHFTCNFGMDSVAQALTLTQTNRICPELASITLYANVNTDLSLLGEVIFSRRCIPRSAEWFDTGLGGGHQLERVTICGDVQRKYLLDIPAIALCVAEGLELHCDRRRSSLFV